MCMWGSNQCPTSGKPALDCACYDCQHVHMVKGCASVQSSILYQTLQFHGYPVKADEDSIKRWWKTYDDDRQGPMTEVVTQAIKICDDVLINTSPYDKAQRHHDPELN